MLPVQYMPACPDEHLPYCVPSGQVPAVMANKLPTNVNNAKTANACFIPIASRLFSARILKRLR
jgi:hypothetical protein